MTAIAIESLSKSFGETTGLADLSLMVETGELYGLLGPNGAGKTTTIDILTGQTSPDTGKVRVLDTDPVESPIAVRERVGILPEKQSPPSLMTPREYLHFCGTVRELSDDMVDRGIATWSKRLDFAEKLDTLSTDLSRGQQQKVMIASAFLHEPALVCIDEPLANLDPIVQERVKRVLTDYRDAGNTILLSTHNIDVAADLCSRVGILNAGRCIAEVRPGELEPGRTLLDEFFEKIDGASPGTSPSHA